MSRLEVCDMDDDFDRSDRENGSVKAIFNDILGKEDVVVKLEGYQRIVKNIRELKLGDPRDYIPFCFLFKGPPGTGKTTAANKMGGIFYEMGLLAKDEVVECSASDLSGEQAGQTVQKMRRVFEKAAGKVLFVKKACKLNTNMFNRETLNEMSDLLTREKYVNRLVVIIAGSAEDIDALMRINPNLSSRFPETTEFSSLTPDVSASLLLKYLEDQKLDISGVKGPVLDGALRSHFQSLASLPSWGNARDIQTLARNVFARIMAKPTGTLSLEVRLADLIAVLKDREQHQPIDHSVAAMFY